MISPLPRECFTPKPRERFNPIEYITYTTWKVRAIAPCNSRQSRDSLHQEQATPTVRCPYHPQMTTAYLSGQSDASLVWVALLLVEAQRRIYR